MDYLKKLLNPNRQENMSKMTEDEMLYTPAIPEIEVPRLDNNMQNEIVEEEVNDIVEAPNAPKETKEDVIPEISPQEKLLSEYRSYLNKQERDVKDARIKDAERDLLGNLNKSFQQIGTGLASGYANVKMDPLDIGKSNFEQQARMDSKDRLNALMQEYKLLEAQSKKDTPSKSKRYFNTSDGIVEVDQETGDTRLVRESELKRERENRLREQFEFGKDVKGRLSDKEVEKVAAFDEGIRIFDQIDNLLETTDVEKDLGPYASRLENLSDKIPGVELDEDFVKTQQLVGIQLADYIKSISGAAVSEEEAQRLLKNIPSVTDKPKAFKTKLDQIRKEIEEAKDNTLRNIGKQKESALKFRDNKKDDIVTMIAPNGQRARVKRDQVQKYLDKGARIEE